jgi:hypothetical protein
MGADMKRTLIKLYDKLHLVSQCGQSEKFVLKFQKSFP